MVIKLKTLGNLTPSGEGHFGTTSARWAVWHARLFLQSDQRDCASGAMSGGGGRVKAAAITTGHDCQIFTY